MSRRLQNPELGAIEVHGMTRTAFLLRGTLAAGAMYGAGAVAPFVSSALAQATTDDNQVLSFALGLEQLEAAFYTAALKSAKLTGQLKTLATEFGKQEQQHADALKLALTQLGGKAPPPSTVKLNARDRTSFLKIATQLEDVGVGAYNGAIPLLKTPDIVDATASIVQVEARHAAALRFRAGQNPAPAAFDKPLSPQQVQAALKQAAKG